MEQSERPPAFPEDVAWAPPPQIIRLLARQTAVVALPPPPVPVTDDDVVEASADSPVYRREAASDALSDAKHVDTGAESVGMSTSVGNTMSRTTLGQASSQRSLASTTGSRLPSPPPHNHYAIREVSLPSGDTSWKACHDVPWDRSEYRTHHVHEPPTAKLCSCRTAFAPGEQSCSRCGMRRPVLLPEHPRMEKAMFMMDPDHSDPWERNHAWAAVYSERLHRTQLAKFEDHEDWMLENGYFHPQLNENSLQIAELLDAPPLHERTPEIMAKREEYLELCRKQREDKEVEGATFQPELHPKSANRTGWKLHSLYKWDDKRAQKANAKLEAQLDVEAKQCPFSPMIGSKSQQIAQGYADHKQVHERLVSDSKRRNREYNQEQDILKTMRPQDFKDMWVDTPEPDRKRSVGFSPKKPLPAPVAKALAQSSNRDEPKEPKPQAKPATSHRASMSLLSGMDAKGMRGSRSSPSIGRMSRASRTSRLSRSRSLASSKALACPKTSTTSGVNTVLLKTDFKDIAGSLLP